MTWKHLLGLKGCSRVLEISSLMIADCYFDHTRHIFMKSLYYEHVECLNIYQETKQKTHTKNI